jgi:glucan phosphorylase
MLTLAVACQFTGYKRPNLLIHDPDRLTRMLTHPERPVQDYTPRIVPFHPEAIISIEESHSLWQR